MSVDVGFAELTGGRANSPTILEVNGGGVALFDADGDHDLDVLLVDPGAYPEPGVEAVGSNRLYRNDGDFHFVDVTPGSGVDLPGTSHGVAVGDVDGDGDRDLYITRLGPNALLLNQGGLRFLPATDAGGAAGDAWSTSAVMTDMDLDGVPEIVAGAYYDDERGLVNVGSVLVFSLESDCDGDGVGTYAGDCGDGESFVRKGDGGHARSRHGAIRPLRPLPLEGDGLLSSPGRSDGTPAVADPLGWPSP